MFFVFSLMRDAEKLMSRCIYLNILKATIIAAKENQTSSETLEKYVTKLESDKSSCGGTGVFDHYCRALCQ